MPHKPGIIRVEKDLTHFNSGVNIQPGVIPEKIDYLVGRFSADNNLGYRIGEIFIRSFIIGKKYIIFGFKIAVKVLSILARCRSEWCIL
jgi:hypothetical protein